MWKEIHYTPEEAVKAHQTVKGKLIVPSGWGTFNFALFPWHEPIKRFLLAVKEERTDYLTPKIGEIIIFGQEGGRTEWWEQFIKGKDEETY